MVYDLKIGLATTSLWMSLLVQSRVGVQKGSEKKGLWTKTAHVIMQGDARACNAFRLVTPSPSLSVGVNISLSSYPHI